MEALLIAMMVLIPGSFAAIWIATKVREEKEWDKFRLYG